MLILCRDYKSVYNTDHIFRLYVEEDKSDPLHITWDIMCMSTGDTKFSYYLGTYSNSDRASKALYDLLVAMESGKQTYIIKEEEDFESTDNNYSITRYKGDE